MMSPQSGPCVRSVSESDITRHGDSNSSTCYKGTSNNTTTSWDSLTLDSSTLPLPPKRGRYTKLPAPDIYPPPPGILQRAPSQATMHFTTVPQSLVSRNIGSRHHPTRSSLRHSRMLVMIKDGKVPRKYLPGVVSRMQYGIFLCLAQLFLGSLLAGLAIWKLSIQHHIYSRGDWPLYSGILVLLSGWSGLVLVCCCRYYYPGSTHHTCIFPIKTSSILLSLFISLISSLLTLVSSISHLLHLITFHSSHCSQPPPPPGWPPLSCLCLSESRLWEQGELVYPGSSCAQINTFLHPLLLSLTILNLLAMISSLSYMLLLSCSKHNLTFRNWRNNRKTERAEGCHTPILARNVM
eukprot:GFUD01024238.1.p1 GENE.GFUD01024238.1~~GFUD01024238.1.p1  ORF type:complete len:351 (+),score=86.25 GFUD01024238.1:238-1290(+)